MEETLNADGSVHISIHGGKSHNERLRVVRSCLTYQEDTEQETKSASHFQKRKMRCGKQKEIQKSPVQKSVLPVRDGGEKGQRKRSSSQASSRSLSVFSHLGSKRREEKRKDKRELIRSYITCSKSKDSSGGRHWKRQPMKTQKGEGVDLSEPYDEESTTPFTRRINKSFHPGEKAAANQSKRRGQPWKQQNFHKPCHEQNFERKEDFRRRLRDRRGNHFTPLTKTPKEILAMEAGKGTFTTPPLMLGAPESRNKNKYYDFHGDNTGDCLHLKR
ncbi:hypothetical protein Tco_1053490 [Tanacetum coccineum]|uniref:Uncharacterized protein n=1 Tax=Tanacetum coccineum TaxID=301880 RepID=A0ABQ5GWH6_9ASTR